MEQATVGMAATIRVGSDSYPATVVRVSKSGRTFWLQRDNAVPTEAMRLAAARDGYGSAQSYLYTPDLEAPVERASFRKHGPPRLTTGASVVLGVRRRYNDPHF